jgi:hypothetical protein
VDVLAALGDAPTAVIAVVAIVLGVVLAARGQRGERAADHGAADEVRPSLLKMPIAGAEPATDADGLRTMAIGEVGHGAIRLGRPGLRIEPAPVAQVPPQVQALPPESQPAAVAAPGPEPAAEPESAEEPPAPAPHDPPSPPEPAPALHDPPPEPATLHDPAPEPATPHDPAPGAVPFRQGTIKLRQPSDD